MLAQPRGFCAGVVRAIEIVERALDRWGAPVFVLHEIVHNPHVLAALSAKGAVFVESVDDIPPGAVMVISAHGTPGAVETRAQTRSLHIVDATCPFVRKVHREGRSHAGAGRAVVLIGHAGHAETVGTMGRIDAPVHLVQTVADVAALGLPADTPIGYITQTTLSIDETATIVAALHARFSDVTAPASEDICYATQNRQAAVRRLCEQVDRLLVIGAANSSNSNRLVELGASLGVPSHLIDSWRDLDPAWISAGGTIGLTAGASAPDHLVAEVIEMIRRRADVCMRTLDGPVETMALPLPLGLRGPSEQRKYG